MGGIGGEMLQRFVQRQSLQDQTQFPPGLLSGLSICFVLDARLVVCYARVCVCVCVRQTSHGPFVV